MATRHGRSRHASAPELVARWRDRIPLAEVSGLAVGRWHGELILAAVGDHGPDVAYAPLTPAAGQGVGDWLVVDLSTLEAPRGLPRVRQAEAIALDGVRRAAVLIEDPAVLLVVDMPVRRIERGYLLDVIGVEGVDDAWARDGSSRGEGIVLMLQGHVLVVKEKRPGGLLEFGPPGTTALGVSASTLLPPGQPWTPPDAERLTALSWWPGDESFDDFSDAAVDSDGFLHLLSDRSRAIGRVRLPLLAGAGQSAVLDRIWRLPDDVDKAEGLAFLPDGSAVVAVDHPKVGRNLVGLAPARDWPDGSPTG